MIASSQLKGSGQMTWEMERGARIITERWLRVRPWDRVLIVACANHLYEAETLRRFALLHTKTVDILKVENAGRHAGVFFDENENVFDPYTAVIAATEYSLVTTRAAKRAMERRKKFLSLPLSTNDGRSMLEYDFLTMDTEKSRMLAKALIKYLRRSANLRVTTPAGTDLRMRKEGRMPGFFNGAATKGCSSASIETYVPIEETRTEGLMVLDGSLGYIGRVEEPTRIAFEDGRVVDIENTTTGERLRQYMEDYRDPGIYVAGEFGIGLNFCSKCRGNCYIEDESAYGTFHIGLGRNLALGGIHSASGHFDLVCLEPNVYADNTLIMRQGQIIVPEALPYLK